MTVTLQEVLQAAELRSASLVAELSGYLVLGAADRIVGAPRVVDMSGVVLESEGVVNVTGGTASEDVQAEVALRSLLACCLRVSRAGAPAIHRAAHPTTQVGLRGLIAELEAALIPVNRSAGRRALARLHREALRAKQAGLIGAGTSTALSTRDERRGNDEREARDTPMAVEPSGRAASMPFRPVPNEPPLAWSSTRTSEPESASCRIVPGPVACVSAEGGAPMVEPGTDQPLDEEPTQRFVGGGAAPPEPCEMLTCPTLDSAVEGHTERIVVLTADPFRERRVDAASQDLARRSSITVSPGLGGRFEFPASALAPAARVELRENREATQRLELGQRSTTQTGEECAGTPASNSVTPTSSVTPMSDVSLLDAGGAAQSNGQSPAAAQPALLGRDVTVVQHTRWSHALDGHVDDAPDETPHTQERVTERAPLPAAPRVFAPRRSDVSQLVDDFGTSGVRTDRELCHDLQQLAGVDATPGNLPLVRRRD